MAETSFSIGKIKTPLKVSVGNRATTFMFPPEIGEYIKSRDNLRKKGLQIPSARNLADLMYCALNHVCDNDVTQRSLSNSVLNYFENGIQSSVYYFCSRKNLAIYLLQNSELDHLPNEEELKILSDRGGALHIPGVSRSDLDYAQEKHPLWKAIFGEEMSKKLISSRQFHISPSFNALLEKPCGFLTIVLSKPWESGLGRRDLSFLYGRKPYICGTTNQVSDKLTSIDVQDYDSYKKSILKEKNYEKYRNSLPSHEESSCAFSAFHYERHRYGLNPDA